jgi:hypothetical protein
MSAYQVDENTIYDVLHLIRKSYGSGPYYEEKQEMKLMVVNRPFTLFDNLVKLNIYSLKNRYSDYKKMIRPMKFNWTAYGRRINMANDFQFFKSTQCFTYQSCEGKAGNKKLYKLVHAFEQEFATQLVDKMPEYQQASWGAA